MKGIRWITTGIVIAALSMATSTLACTGLTLKAKNGDIIYGRTLEWGMFDLHSRIQILPRNMQYTGATPDGAPGITWKGKYGVAGIDVLEKLALVDAMNETGLVGGLFYHPGYATYTPYDPKQANISMGPTDVMQYLLSTCSSVAEVREAISKVRVVPVVEKALGFPAPIHLIFTEPSGKQIVIEWFEGKARIFDAPLGVITNAPTYDWHITNLRNYINLSPVALPGVEIDSLNFKPLGAGSGMIGLPGDFTPPSRFVRAVAFAKTARPVPDGTEGTYELFRILDSFNVPLGAAEGSTGTHDRTEGMRSATLWTSAQDLGKKVLYYHTQHNRQVRKIDVAKINFDKLDKVLILPLDKKKEQNIEDRTPAL